MKNTLTLFFLVCFTMSSEIQNEDFFNDDVESEYYSWDMKPIDPYEHTEIIIDPYASLKDQSLSESDPSSAYRSFLSP